MKKSHNNKFKFLIGSAILGIFLLSPLKNLQAQEEKSNRTQMEEQAENLPDKNFSLELIPLEGNHVNPAKCQATDAQSIHLLPGQKLTVTLNKKWLFYQQAGKATLGTNYNVQSEVKIDDWDGWKNWMLDDAPLEWKGCSFANFYNNYFYQAGNSSGKATLSFISQTYPRYYSSVKVIVDKEP